MRTHTEGRFAGMFRRARPSDDERPQGAMIGKQVCIIAWLLTRRLHIKKPAEHPAGESITIFLYYICDIPG